MHPSKPNSAWAMRWPILALFAVGVHGAFAYFVWVPHEVPVVEMNPESVLDIDFLVEAPPAPPAPEPIPEPPPPPEEPGPS